MTKLSRLSSLLLLILSLPLLSTACATNYSPRLNADDVILLAENVSPDGCPAPSGPCGK